MLLSKQCHFRAYHGVIIKIAAKYSRIQHSNYGHTALLYSAVLLDGMINTVNCFSFGDRHIRGLTTV